MPLPASGTGQWPPADVARYVNAANKAAAWWSGDRWALQTAGHAGVVHHHPHQADRRRFWQRRQPGRDTTQATSLLHAPLASDIAAVSSDLLFGDPVKITHPDTAVQDAIDEVTDQVGLENTLTEAAELAAATGGVYLRPVWDLEFTDHPISRAHDQRDAVPDFRYGQLVAVTLWEELVGTDNTVVYRHLERHEPGVIYHGLYEGTRSDLGNAISLDAHPSTKGLLPEMRLTGALAGQLLVDYVPNLLPNRSGSKPIGRADWAGADDFLDALDETWTSLMRDVRLGQARIIVPQEWIEQTGGRPGQAKLLNIDDEAFVGINIQDQTQQASMKPEVTQPDLRVQAHVDTALALTERIVSACGYSPQTFGLHIDGNAQSGTALRIREGKTDKTTAKKQRYWQPNIANHVTKLLAIRGEIFGQRVDLAGERVKVAWPELERDPAEQATWVNTLRTAQAMSVENAVKAAQPDLEGDDLAAEIDRVKAESAAAVAPDPLILP